MQKYILITSILGLFLSTACETSHKGKWSNSDKELARKQMTEACNNDYFSDSALKQQYIDCYLKKLEINFNSSLNICFNSSVIFTLFLLL